MELHRMPYQALTMEAGNVMGAHYDEYYSTVKSPVIATVG
jgi:hypothetical protein